MVYFINHYINNVFQFFGFNLRCSKVEYMYNFKKDIAIYEIPMDADRYLTLKRKGFKSINVWEFKKISKRQKKSNRKLTPKELDYLFD